MTPQLKTSTTFQSQAGLSKSLNKAQGPTAGKYHSAIIIRSGAQGDLNIKEATIEGEVVNLSTATLYASATTGEQMVLLVQRSQAADPS